MENQYQTRKLLSLTQGLVYIFEEVTASSGDKNIDKEWGGKYYMAMVMLFLLFLLMLVFCCFCLLLLFINYCL